jgi:hypothetical protein
MADSESRNVRFGWSSGCVVSKVCMLQVYPALLLLSSRIPARGVPSPASLMIGSLAMLAMEM